jgi:predicted murein hydrolase (TIGR00659 family)
MEFFREDLHVFLVHFEDHAFFSIVITSGAYVIAAAIWQKSGRCSVIHPVLVATLLVVALLLATGMSYRVYFRQAYLLNETLGVVVVLLAVPLYRQFPLIRASGLSIFIALLAGSLVALASALAVPAATGSASSILATLAPKSATAAVAVEIADRLGGTASLTAVVVISTGIFGAVFGPAILKAVRIRDDRAVGFALGVASHAIGTARAFQISETAGAFSTLGMILNAIITIALAPAAVAIAAG